MSNKPVFMAVAHRKQRAKPASAAGRLAERQIRDDDVVRFHAGVGGIGRRPTSITVSLAP
jgi:hypothetical protein